MAKIEALFLDNGYPTDLYREHKLLYHDRTRPGEPRHKPKKDNKQHEMTYISLPYIDDQLARRVDDVVRSSGLKARVAWVSGKTLAKHVIRSALENPPCPAGFKRCNTCDAGLAGRCHVKNAVYKIWCFV